MIIKNSYYVVKEILNEFPMPSDFGIVKGIRAKNSVRKWCKLVIRRKGKEISNERARIKALRKETAKTIIKTLQGAK